MLFSIITVTYNAAPLIGATIASVESQTFDGIEHVIVDGNSCDDTLTRVHHYQERNSLRPKPRPITCISEPDRGLYDAMNKGIGLASGRYVVFLNAGDTISSADTLERLAARLEADYGLRSATRTLPAVLYGDTVLVRRDGSIIGPRRLRPPKRLTPRSFLRGMLVCHQSFYVRADLARRHKYDLDYRFSADFDWCIRVMQDAAANALPLYNSRLVLTRYLDEGGVTKQNHRASLIERFRIMRKHYGLIPAIAAHGRILLRAMKK